MANDAGIVDPFVVKFDATNGVATNGDDARFSLGGLTQSLPSSTFGYDSGVYPGSFDSGGILDLRVAAQTSPNMTVTVQPGNYVVARSGHGAYWGCLTAAQTVTIAANGAGNPRYDMLVVRNRDSGIGADGTVTKSAFLFPIQGTPAATPTEPAITDGDVILARILVRASTSSILTSDITDRRIYETARGGITPASSIDTRNGCYEGHYRDNQTTHNLERWTSGAWVPMASPSSWTQYTPTLWVDRNTDPDIAVNLGTGGSPGPLYIGRYAQTGKRLDFTYYFHWGSSGFNGFYGRIYVTLPNSLVAAPYNQWVQCHLWVNNAVYVGDFHGQAIVFAGTNVVMPFFCASRTDNATFPYVIAATSGTPSSGCPLISGGYPEGGDFTISGSIEVQ